MIKKYLELCTSHLTGLKILVRQNPFNKIFTILQVEAKIKNIEWRIYI